MATAVHILLLVVQAMIVAWLLFYFFSRRDRYGVGAFIVLLGMFQPLQNLLAAGMWLEIAPGWNVNPGSTILFPANLIILLLLDAQKRRPDTLRLLRILAYANLAYFLLTLSYVFHGGTNKVLGIASKELFGQMTWLTISGGTVLWLDALILLFLWDKLKILDRRDSSVAKGIITRAGITILAVLVFDSLCFSVCLCWNPFLTGDSAATLSSPFDKLVLTQITAKVLAGLLYVLAMSLYFSRVEPDAGNDWLGRHDPHPSLLAAEKHFERDFADIAAEATRQRKGWVAYSKDGRLGFGASKSELDARYRDVDSAALLIRWIGFEGSEPSANAVAEMPAEK